VNTAAADLVQQLMHCCQMAEFWPLAYIVVQTALYPGAHTLHSGMGCSQEIQDAAAAACGQVAAHEQAFWQMAYEG